MVKANLWFTDKKNLILKDFNKGLALCYLQRVVSLKNFTYLDEYFFNLLFIGKLQIYNCQNLFKL